jgi:hypothetical protein
MPEQNEFKCDHPKVKGIFIIPNHEIQASFQSPKPDVVGIIVDVHKASDPAPILATKFYPANRLYTPKGRRRKINIEFSVYGSLADECYYVRFYQSNYDGTSRNLLLAEYSVYKSAIPASQIKRIA